MSTIGDHTVRHAVRKTKFSLEKLSKKLYILHCLFRVTFSGHRVTHLGSTWVLPKLSTTGPTTPLLCPWGYLLTIITKADPPYISANCINLTIDTIIGPSL